MKRPSAQASRKLTAEEKADVQNFRGFGASWQRIAEFFGIDVADLQNQMQEPQWKEPLQAE